MVELYFVRHGETQWNALGKYQGYSDIPLSDRGLEQASFCAQRLSNVPFQRIITSDLSRAKVTAETIAEHHDCDVLVDKGLREICFGDWEALTYEDIAAQWPEEIEALYSHPESVEIPNGETWTMVQDRAIASIVKAVNAADPKAGPLLFVCHGGTIRAVLCKLLGLPLNYTWKLAQGNTAVSVVQFNGLEKGDINVLQLLNDQSHLRG